jgi:heat shock protein HtpX
MSHVRHFDIRLMMLLATLVGMVVLVVDGFWRSLRYRMWSGGGRRGGSRDGGGAAILFVLAIALGLVAPLIGRLIQLAASRQREYLADAGAVELTRNPEAMIAALRKLGDDREVLEVANRATAHLYIVEPIKAWEKRAAGLFATHPPLEERIARIARLVTHARPEGSAHG